MVEGQRHHDGGAGRIARITVPTWMANLDAKLRHVLVDEVQDTNPAQFELLALLTADWTAGDGRTLFLVGDPMQSIYLFRDADVCFARTSASALAGCV